MHNALAPWTHIHACMQHARAMRARAHACVRASCIAVCSRMPHKKQPKKVPLLQTKERFKSKRARARWRAVGRAAIGNRYKPDRWHVTEAALPVTQRR